MQEFSVRKTTISVRCPSCKKLHYLTVGLIDKDVKIHRGGTEKEKVVN